MKTLISLLLLLVACSMQVQGRIYSREELGRRLVQQGVPRDMIGDWICMAEHESRRDTSAVGRGNADGSTDWGIFQINDRYWCDVGSKGCQISCSELTTDDITQAIKCAMFISGGGYDLKPWVAWVRHCQGRDVSHYMCG